MLFLTSALALSLAALPIANANAIQAKVVRPAAQQQDTKEFTASVAPDSNVLTLTKRGNGRGYNSRSAAWLLQKDAAVYGKSCGHHRRRGDTSLLSLEEGEEFDTQIKVGGQKFEVIVDTGSSDTWLAQVGFQCANATTHAPLPESACLFGPLYQTSRSFRQIPNENLNITYGDGETVTGIEGTERVEVGGLHVRQQIGVVNFAAWDGDGVSTGLMGLAYPALTSAFAGNDPSQDGTASAPSVIYRPIIETLIAKHRIAPYFSLAIDRDVNGTSGYLALGGLPPVPFKKDFSTTPILVTQITGYPKNYDFYTINIDNLVIADTPYTGAGGSQYQYIVDSGTTLAYIPNQYADAVNAAFSPPGEYNDEQGAYIVNCNATAPEFGVTISGRTFQVNPLDMILLGGTDEQGNEFCISGVTQGGNNTDTIYILGDTFQHNVVTVFDVGATKLHFAAREFYPSNDPVKL